MRFQGKNVVITGGNSGIGLATAKAFVREGARVAIIGRSAETLAAARAELGKDAIAISAELSRVAEIDRAFAEVRAAFGTVDVLFANAGGGGMIPSSRWMRRSGTRSSI
jgi:NAD(P)-dependent dehydrogenase (short-subunit alcohol dehydrogenase family)